MSTVSYTRTVCLVICLIAWSVGCDSGGGDGGADAAVDSGFDAGIPPTSFVRFAPNSAPITFGDVPFPSDLYLDGSGRVQLADVPDMGATATPELRAAMLEALAESDGFGLTTSLFIYVDGPVDASSLAGNVHLVDLSDGSSIPVESFYWADKGYVALIPTYGAALRESQRYGYYATRGARSPDGAPLGASDDFIAIRDAAARPADPRLGAAWDVTLPLFDHLRNAGVDLDAVVGGGVFTTQTISAPLVAMRAGVYADPPPVPQVTTVVDATSLDSVCGTPLAQRPGYDNPGGVIHGSYFAMVHGTVPLPGYNSDSPLGQGIFEYDANGDPIKKGDIDVPFTLVLPAGADPLDMPVAIYGHGIQNTRGYLFSVAETLAASGIATIAIDLPFHGSRSLASGDNVNNVTGAPGADGFGDEEEDLSVALFFGLGTTDPALERLDPRISRDTMRQVAIETVALTRALLDGDWNAVGAAAGLPGLVFRPDRLAIVSQSFGSFMAVPALAVEDRIGAAFLSVLGGGLLHRILPNSPNYAPAFLPLAVDGLGVADDISLDTLVERPARFHPVITLWQQVVERSDGLAFASLLVGEPDLRGGNPLNIVQTAALHDELVPNQANELSAAATGLPLCTLSSGGATARFFAFMDQSYPAQGNLTFPGGSASGCFVIYDAAAHQMLIDQQADLQTQPPFPPFEFLPQPLTVNNPIELVHAQLLPFVRSYFDSVDGVATILDPSN